MTKTYYFNNNVDSHGKHEIHTEDCIYLEKTYNKTIIGDFKNCNDALKNTIFRHFPKRFDGCYYCCNECHTG